MMTTLKTTLLLLVTLVPLPGAEEPSAAEYQEQLFRQVDANGDGKLTEKEFVVTVLYDDFMAVADKKGRVSRARYFQWVAKHPEIDGEKEYAMMDAEGKGYLVFADVMRNTIAIEEMKREFRKLDKKRRGYITRDDLPDLKQ